MVTMVTAWKVLNLFVFYKSSWYKCAVMVQFYVTAIQFVRIYLNTKHGFSMQKTILVSQNSLNPKSILQITKQKLGIFVLIWKYFS